MRQWKLRRLGALALALALLAPAAWAAPGGARLWGLDGVWEVVWGWVSSAWAQDKVEGVPGGLAGPGGCGAGDCTDDGPGYDPHG